MGQAAVFLRLANCNLSCSWCDTRYSWDWVQFDPADERHVIELSDLTKQLIAELQEVRLLIITGGEPLLQQPALIQLVVLLREYLPSLRVEIETNGTIDPTSGFSELINLFVVSPKLANSKQSKRRRLRRSALASFPLDRTVLKFVVTDPQDLSEVQQVLEIAGLPPERTWIMPEGTTPDGIAAGLRALADPATRLGYNLSTRLHILLWENIRAT